jgi:NADPH:quinone reductase-like Zn-dependent oxidoreductase
MKNRIVRFDNHGGPEVLNLINEAIKEPKDDEVRIKVKALGLNQAEVMLREGRYVASPNFPARIGIEASGIVDSIGNNVSSLKIGDSVCAIPFLSWNKNDYWTADSINNYGVYGDSAIVPAWTIAKKIESQSYEEAAAAWCQYLTAWGGLVYNSDIEKRNCCIFTGASSSAAIGGMQIVKAFGLKAYAISRTLAKKEKLLNVGYDEVLSLTDPKLEENIMDLTNGIGFDLAYDCVGGEYFINLVNAAKARGLIVNYGNLNNNASNIKTLPLLAKRIHIRFHSVFDTMRFQNQREEGIEWINKKMEEGTLKPIISKVFNLEDIVEAHKYLAEGNQLGKTIVVT